MVPDGAALSGFQRDPGKASLFIRRQQIMTKMANPQTAQAANNAVSWQKIVLWTVLFQIAWFWRKLPDLLTQGAMPDTDDFQRLAQIRSWMNGQDWFDVTNYRMDFPNGADMHWSRLVDIPIAGLIWFFDLFTDTVMAERIASIIWPMALLVATVFVVLAICRRLDAATNPLVVLLFTVTCITALTEFMPGRLDHHGLQILLFTLMLLGMVSVNARWAPWLTGAAIAASISIGLDSILLIMFALAWIGLEWTLGWDSRGRRLASVGLSMAATSLILFAANVPSSRWLVAACDANSIVYLTVLWSVAAAFVTLSLFTDRLTFAHHARTVRVRLGACAVLGATAAAAVIWFFPQCMAGPYGTIDPQLAERWLVNVSEARGLWRQLETTPQMWLSSVLYGLLLLAVATFVLMRRASEQRGLLVLFAMLVISMAASFLQYRAMRIGVFAAIPFCVLFVELSWKWLQARWRDERLLAMAAQTATVILLLPPAWLGLAAVIVPETGAAAVVTKALAADAAGQHVPEWKTRDIYIFCNRQDQYEQLAAIPRSNVMTGINSGPPAVVFTPHNVVGGPYHRNAEAILDMLDFYETDLENPRRIARERAIEYVTYCEPGEEIEPDKKDSPALAIHIRNGTEPAWLERISDPEARLHLFRVVDR